MNPYALGPRIGLLLRRRAFRLAALVWAVASVGVLFLPMAGRPGYANALAANLLVGILGLVVGVAAARVEQDIGDVRARPDVPLHLKSAPGLVRAVALPVLAASVVLGLGVAFTGVLSLINGLRVGTCDLGADLVWYPVLPLVSVPLAAVCGVALGSLARSRVMVVVLGLLLLVASAAVTAWPILTGPQAFVFDHLLGYLPGPLYDEQVSVTRAVVGYQGLTLAWAVLGVGLLALMIDDADFRVRLRLGGGRLPAAILVLVAGVTVGVLEGHRSSLGFYQSNASIARALGGTVRTPHFVIHYPKEESPGWVHRMVEEHELRYAELIRWLKLPDGSGAPVTSWIFRSSDEKRRLMGAGLTDIAKPWLHAFFIDAGGFPPPVLEHELAHVLAGAFGRGPFKVATSDGLVPNQGFEEGLAVAANWPARGPLTIHGWARAMRALGVAPPIQGLFSSAGFLTQAPSRAYTLAGSFVRWLVDTQGIDKVKVAYRAGDLTKLGDPAKLFHDWGAFLDSQPVSPLARRLAEARFRRPSIVLRPCAFDVTRALARARADLAAGNTAGGIKWIRKCIALEPDAPWHLRTLMDAQLRAGDLKAAKATADKLLHHPKADPSLKSQADIAPGPDRLAPGRHRRSGEGVPGRRRPRGGRGPHPPGHRLDDRRQGPGAHPRGPPAPPRPDAPGGGPPRPGPARPEGPEGAAPPLPARPPALQPRRLGPRPPLAHPGPGPGPHQRRRPRPGEPPAHRPRPVGGRPPRRLGRRLGGVPGPPGRDPG